MKRKPHKHRKEGQEIDTDLRVNLQIRAREVRVIDEDGAQVGIMPLAEALSLAQRRGGDLVEVAPQASPPVCRVLDYSKWRFEQSKRERAARKNQKGIEVSEVRLRPKMDPHDVEYRLRQAQKFLAEGRKVKLFVLFRARELSRPQFGVDILQRAAERLKEDAVVEGSMVTEGRTIFLMLAPAKQRAKAPSLPAAPVLAAASGAG